MNQEKVISKTNKKKNLFFVGILEMTTKRAGSGNKVYGSKDPDPYQNATDPEHALVC
jgi:hypothetical protein